MLTLTLTLQDWMIYVPFYVGLAWFTYSVRNWTLHK